MVHCYNTHSITVYFTTQHKPADCMICTIYFHQTVFDKIIDIMKNNYPGF